MVISAAVNRRCVWLVFAGMLCGCGRFAPFRGFAFSRQSVPATTPSTAVEVLPPSSGYLQSGPVLANSQTINAAPVTATEQLVELRKQLEDLKFSYAKVDSRVQELTAEVAAKDGQLSRAEDEMRLAKKECESVRHDLESWRQDVEQLRSRLSQHQRREMDSLNDLENRLARTLAVYLPSLPAPETREDDGSRDSLGTLPATREAEELDSTGTPLGSGS